MWKTQFLPEVARKIYPSWVGSREAVNARQAAMYLVRRMTNLSTPDIGREFGKRDHTTVLHSLEQIEKKILFIVPSSWRTLDVTFSAM